jgi:glycosyltransferase involved in cell wall biosynthesis
VLHVITHLDHGGAQDNTLLTVEHLDRSRYEVAVASGPGVLATEAERVADHLFVLPTFRRRLLDPGDLQVARELFRLSKSYDVVHTHGSKAGIIGRAVARAARVPAIVHTVHGFPVTPATPRPVRWLLLSLERLAAAVSHAVICVCDANAKEALSLRIADPRRLHVVVSGVPTESVRSGSRAVRRDLGIPSNAPLVTTITRFMEQKAPLDFVTAGLAILAQRRDAYVLMVGDGPLRQAVHAAAGGHPRFKLVGFRSDVPDILAASDVIAFTSLWEGLGRALTEAVVAGKPIVATAVNGVPDLVVDGDNGYLCAPGHPLDIAARVLDVLDLPDRGASLGARGAARIGDAFGIEPMVNGISEVYEACLATRTPRGAA